MTILETHIVPAQAAGDRLSNYACIAFEKIIPSRKGIKKAIKRGSILVDGIAGQTGWKLRTGQKLELLSNYTKIPKIYELKLEVLFENEQFAVIHKPHGLLISGNQFRTLYNCLGYNLKETNEQDRLPYPTPCHRLDKATSGCVLIAKTKSAQLSFNKMFEQKEIRKTYLAIVHGKIPLHGYINTPINGQDAQTKFKRIELIQSKSGSVYSKVKMYPLTGRTHQLRIHFSSLGHPILGDKLYGTKGNTLLHKGLFLCALALYFCSTSGELKVQTAVPNKFNRFVKLIST